MAKGRAFTFWQCAEFQRAIAQLAKGDEISLSGPRSGGSRGTARRYWTLALGRIWLATAFSSDTNAFPHPLVFTAYMSDPIYMPITSCLCLIQLKHLAT